MDFYKVSVLAYCRSVYTKGMFTWIFKKSLFFAGLNPTGPCFDPAQADKCKGKAFQQYMLNKSDAEYVEVLFTGREYWGICQPHVEGEKSDMGHAIYFANGGYKEPGCEKLDSGGKIAHVSPIRPHRHFQSVLRSA